MSNDPNEPSSREIWTIGLAVLAVIYLLGFLSGVLYAMNNL